MRNDAINLGSMSFLLADSNPHTLSIAHSVLRSFGALKVTGVRNAQAALEVLVEHRPDMMLCDVKLPPVGGISFIRFVRGQHGNPFRTLPILAMTGDTRVSNIKQTRDCGANMVIAQPMSPAALYDRLVWVAFNPRKFVDTQTYSGPDRRMRAEGTPEGFPERRSEGEQEVIAVDNGGEPALSQSEIDNLFSSARG